MKIKRLPTGTTLFVILVIVFGVVTARKIQEAGWEWLPNEDFPSEGNKEVQISLPRLPQNEDHLETTPLAVSNTSSSASPSSDRPAESSGPKKILLPVPFTSQAPTGKWIDARFQDGCEEASALMAVRWAQGKQLTTQEAEEEILAISEYEQEMFGTFHDTSAEDTALRILRGYFKFENVEARSDITTQDIQRELTNGNLVIVPVNGRKLGNPYYTPPGPLYHNLVIIGYDPATDEFITNDPGTRRGKGYRYSSSALEKSLQDYPTGYHLPATPGKTAMIVVSR